MSQYPQPPPPGSMPGYPPHPGSEPAYSQSPPPPGMMQSYPPSSSSPQGVIVAQLPHEIPLNCPPGLEYLAAVDQLLVHQKVELLEAFTGFETANKYTIKNSMGQRVYFAAEDTDCCSRNICGPCRAFDMQILDNAGREVIHMYRPLRCSTCWFFCCLQKMEVQSPPGQTIGYVVQDWSLVFPNFRIENAEGETVLRIKGPFCTWSLCVDVEFEVLSADGECQVGKISKQWSGLLKEAFTDADNFGITFPIDLDVKMKAVMLGALFLINTFTDILHDRLFETVAQQFGDILDNLRQGNGTLVAFWMSYIDMVELMLKLLRASREGNWKLHLTSIHEMIP
ncbi:Phospholipid scramblase 2 [Nymphon striatum]|nr:Phospholipid scramblase 2 [Nymphon striatum]